MDSYDAISSEIDKALLHREIINHLQKRKPHPKKPVNHEDHHRKKFKSTKSTSFKVNKKSKIETITIPATTNKVIINLSG